MTRPPIAELQEHIKEPVHHREKECQPYLLYISEFLCRETPKRILHQGREEASRYGFNDYCVSAVISDGSMERRVAYVWEVKSPQSHIFEFDDHSKRLRPTKELVKAETQLFHYVEEFQSSKSFREWFQLDTTGMVVPAGIIIGANHSLVKPSRSHTHNLIETQRLFSISMNARNIHLYNKASLTVKTWDWVSENYSTVFSTVSL